MADVFSESQVESLAHALGGCGTGRDIDQALAALRITDHSGESTKWKRLHWVFSDIQLRDGSRDQILQFIQGYLAPVRFTDRVHDFEECRRQINLRLAFAGLEYGEDGQFRSSEAARTLDEAAQRAQTITEKFRDRRIHPEVLKFCRAELMQDNYFHAVFEAMKGLAQRIRDLADVDEDGVALVDAVFSGDQPALAINSLQTRTERSEQRGFAMLLKGCFAAVRNPLAHEPKILWEGEDDAADYLSFVSLLHRKLDDCVQTRAK